MTYDDWKTKDDQPEDETEQETELQLVYADLARLRASHAALLAAAKEAAQLLDVICENEHEVRDGLQAAIAAAEEPAP